jgi:hypothetical protein
MLVVVDALAAVDAMVWVGTSERFGFEVDLLRYCCRGLSG